MNKFEIWAAYRDVTDFPRKQFEKIAKPPPGTFVIKPLKLPGAFGYPDLYIAWHRAAIGGVPVYLCTYTEKQLTETEAAELMMQAYLKFKENN